MFRVVVATAWLAFSAACSFGVDVSGYFGGPPEQRADTGTPSDAQTDAGLDAAPVEAGGDTGIARVEFTAVAVGAFHACALRADGTVACWGKNNFGQLGNGDPDLADSSVPVLVRGLNDAVEVSAGGGHSCARRKSGALVCWGYNRYGQLGDGSNRISALATPVSGLTDAVQVTTAYDSTCALRADATAVCWGENSNGTLGIGTTDNTNLPTSVSTLTGIARLATNAYYTNCALKKTGEVFCWGYGAYNNAGNTGTSGTPSRVLGLGAASAIATGTYHTCALVAGESFCWGYNGNGQLGNNSRVPSSAPVRAAGVTSATSLITGQYHTCALAAGKLQCWGDNTGGQLGKLVDPDALVPTGVALAKVTQVAAGGYETCALVEGGTVHCWGDNRYGQLGRNTTALSKVPVPVAIREPILSLELGFYHSCAATAVQTLCWGLNDGQTSLGTTAPVVASGTPVASLGAGLSGLHLGTYHSCGLSASGPQCWGYGGSGSLGNGGTAASLRPTPFAPGLAEAAAQIVTGGFHTCALAAGKVLCSGVNVEGELGRQTATANGLTAAPVQRNGADLTGVTRLVSGVYHTCAFVGSEVVCWGYNTSGQLGDGTAVNQFSAVPITLSAQHGALKELALGYLHSCGLFADGRAQCWGANSYGILGDGTNASSRVPVDAATSGLVRELALGTYHTCALLTNGTVECWGYNGRGQLGRTTLTDSSPIPAPVVGIQNAVAIRAINQRTCALLNDGSARCWGDNSAGQLGDGTLTQSAEPQPITDL
jgi:alpha-tubulin suppressor-like RCC1 family protein